MSISLWYFQLHGVPRFMFLLFVLTAHAKDKPRTWFEYIASLSSEKPTWQSLRTRSRDRYLVAEWRSWRAKSFFFARRNGIKQLHSKEIILLINRPNRNEIIVLLVVVLFNCNSTDFIETWGHLPLSQTHHRESSTLFQLSGVSFFVYFWRSFMSDQIKDTVRIPGFITRKLTLSVSAIQCDKRLVIYVRRSGIQDVPSWLSSVRHSAFLSCWKWNQSCWSRAIKFILLMTQPKIN